MFSRLTEGFRRKAIVLSPEEAQRRCIDAIKENPARHLEFTYASGATRGPVLGHPKHERYALTEMRMAVGKQSFGWIEGIEIDVKNRQAIVLHFGIPKEAPRVGLGLALVEAFGKYAKNEHGVTHVLFKERRINSEPAYREFFRNGLGATPIDPKEEEWLWDIP